MLLLQAQKLSSAPQSPRDGHIVFQIRFAESRTPDLAILRDRYRQSGQAVRRQRACRDLRDLIDLLYGQSGRVRNI
jgi:hypothetical protein